MKISNKVCAAVLVATFGMAALVPAAQAAESTWTGEGKVKFNASTTDPEEPEIEIPGGEGEDGGNVDIPQNPDPAKAKIVAVTPLDFGESEIEFGGRVKTFKAKPYLATVKETGKADVEKEIPHFVVFQDLRTNVAKNAYAIKAEITTQFTSSQGAVLRGSEITYDNMAVTSSNNDLTKPALLNAQTTVKHGEKVEFINNDGNDGKGQGTFTLGFGSIADDNAGDSVTLTVPGDVSIVEDTYTATITWTMETV